MLLSRTVLSVLLSTTTGPRTALATRSLSRTAMASQPRTALDEMSKTGAFVRVDSGFRSFISNEEGARFPPVSGRYHLYVSYACPWAHRALITLRLKGLEDHIGVSVVHPTWQKTREDPNDSHHGWVFRSPDDPPLTQYAGHGSFPCVDCVPDTVNGVACVRDLYEKANDTYVACPGAPTRLPSTPHL